MGGVISGTGTLTKSGAGTLILTGENTFGGGTTISAGTLQIGNGGTTGSISGNMIDNGVFVFDRSDALTYAGNISGTGSLVKNGAGTLTLTGRKPLLGRHDDQRRKAAAQRCRGARAGGGVARGLSWRKRHDRSGHDRRHVGARLFDRHDHG